MAIHPDSKFPVLVNDQAEVIRIFLDLMSERERAGRAPWDKANEPLGPLDGCGDLWIQGHMPDFEG